MSDGKLVWFSLPDLIDNPPARQIEQPRLKGASRRVVLELRNAASHGNDRFLHRFLRLLVGKTSLKSDAVNELPISVKEILPAVLVLTVLEPAEQALAGWDEFFRLHYITSFDHIL